MSVYSNRYKYQPASQDFASIKSQCLRSRSLFEDPQFPANNLSIFGTSGRGQLANKTWTGNIYWKRPMELIKNPQFISNGVSRFDVIQGELGNCWFIAAVANLTMHPGLFTTVVPYQSNGFQPGEYCGAFQFRFWQYGTWVNIVIDDRLPCDRHGELLFLHSSDKREFWSALLEKAYAKLHGSYSSLAGGTPSEALQDFSGGIIEFIDLDESVQSDLFYVMKKAYDRSSLITCAVTRRSGGFYEEKTRDGLVRGHAYSITGVQHIRPRNTVVHLVRVRNPWGDHYEWNGAWSDRSPEWNMVDSATKAALGVTHEHDGEFWMSIHDFQRQFSRVEICHISPDPIDSDINKLFKKPWNKEIVEGEWIPGYSAGGCFNYSSFSCNPQYFFNFEASAEDGDPNKCTVIISLIQKMGKRSSSNNGGSGQNRPETIGFRMFKVNAMYRDGTKLDVAILKRSYGKSWNSGAFTDTREVSARFEVPSGNYCIVPSTYEPEIEGQFLLRVFSEPSSSSSSFGAPNPAPAAAMSYQPQSAYNNNPTHALASGLQNLSISSNACPYPSTNNSMGPSLPSMYPSVPRPPVPVSYQAPSPVSMAATPYPMTNSYPSPASPSSLPTYYPTPSSFPQAPAPYPNPTAPPPPGPSAPPAPQVFSSAPGTGTGAYPQYPAMPCYTANMGPVYGTPYPVHNGPGAGPMAPTSIPPSMAMPMPPYPSYGNQPQLPYPM